MPRSRGSRATVPSAAHALVVILVLGCGGAATAATTTATATTPATVSGETETCRAERLATLAAMAASRDGSTCTSAADCAVVTGPGSPSHEDHEVVAAADAAALDARAHAHLAACGAFHHHAAIDAYREVAAACVEGRCAIEETLVHVPPLEE